MVAAGILLSRVIGLVRQRIFAHFFGASIAADAFTAALRIPNFLQNLFGEGVLSASFIPVYASLRARGEDAARRELAGTIFAVLSLLTALLVLAGVLAAPLLVDLIAPGFDETARRDLTVRLVQILFPGAGLLVWSAWCLGVLNSHGKFFLSYASPVVWNAAMIGTLVAFGGSVSLDRLAEYLAWGAVAGSALQFAVQLPTAVRVLGGLRLSLKQSSSTRQVFSTFVPVFIGRGVAQISAFVDSIIASFIVVGAVATLNYAQLIAMLPVSLFGMSISAAELPAMSSALGSREEVAAQLRARLATGLRRISFWIVPSAVAFAAFGDLIAGVLYQGGKFGESEARWVWGVLAGSAVGLLAATMGRLYSSTFYALRDTRTPLRFAILRMTVSTAAGLAFALPLPRALGIDPKWGVAALTMASGLGACLEFALLRGALTRLIGMASLDSAALARLWGAALVAAALGWSARIAGDGWPVIPRALTVLAIYGIAYLVLSWRAGSPEAAALVKRVRRRR